MTTNATQEQVAEQATENVASEKFTVIDNNTVELTKNARGEAIRVYAGEFPENSGKILLQIREFYTEKDTDVLRAGKKGIALPLNKGMDVLEALTLVLANQNKSGAGQ